MSSSCESDDVAKELHRLEAVFYPASQPMQTPGIKYDKDKPRWELLPLDVVEEVVNVLTHGAKKYAPDNWKYVQPRERYLGAVMRHIKAAQCGEVIDPESGLHHIAHAICCLIFFMWHDLHPAVRNDNGTKTDSTNA